jgi:hypothetical protein
LSDKCVIILKMALCHVRTAKARLSKMASLLTCLEPNLGRLEELRLDRPLFLHGLFVDSLDFFIAW